MNLIKKILLDGEIFISQKTVRTLSYFILPLALFIMAYTNYLTQGLGGLYEFSGEIGGLGFNLLLVILFINPLRTILPEFKILAKLLAYRRQLGIATFYILAIHGIGLSISLGIFTQLSTILSDPKNAILWGIIAIILLFLMYITSNNFSVRLLRRNWKRIQRLIYLAVIFSIMHTALIGEFVYAFWFALYLVLKVMSTKKFTLTFFSQKAN